MNGNRMAVIVVGMLAFGLAVRAQPTHPWEVVEVALEAGGEHTNGYVQGLPDRSAPLAQITFTGTSGTARDMRYTLAAFWDGGKTWKARFAPPAPGDWSWSSASKDSGLAAATGKLKVAEWTEAEKQSQPHAPRVYPRKPKRAARRPLLRVRRWHAVPVDR